MYPESQPDMDSRDLEEDPVLDCPSDDTPTDEDHDD